MVVTVDKDIKLNDLIANILYDNADTNNAIFLDYAYLDELVGVLGANGLAVVLKIISLNGEGITPVCTGVINGPKIFESLQYVA